MKIYCNCNFCNNKIYLAASAHSRQQLANSWGINFFIACTSCQLQNNVHINSVNAEATQRNTPFATTAGGGLIGIVAGPLGVLIGLAAGGVAGGIALYNDKEAVRRFNSNYL